eukprot:TRINITY_DN70099_c0_g1_i1.p1 TRINITY_DN70099_c0_g1~~TRINITY_DN70099_c0_g1_i1.p1  ORF type:complete len:461 (+),score=77.34 TRINITY_DN70099_c0_g1_i1:252-1634(+)
MEAECLERIGLFSCGYLHVSAAPSQRSRNNATEGRGRGCGEARHVAVPAGAPAAVTTPGAIATTSASTTVATATHVVSENDLNSSGVARAQQRMKNAAKTAKSVSTKEGITTAGLSTDCSVDGSNAAELGSNAPQLAFVDIGANLLSTMFKGEYHGKQKHEADLDAVIDRGIAAGVRWMMVTAGTLDESRDAVALCRARESSSRRGLACTVGVHPTNCSEFDKCPEGPQAYLRGLRETAEGAAFAAVDVGAVSPVVAVGEFGLDYDRLEFCPRQTQLKYFELQLQELAKPLGLPLFLHCRTSEAAKDLYQILRRNMDCLPSGGRSPGVVHSFDGSLEDAMLFIELGLRIGINGCSLKTAENMEVVRQLPMGTFLLETDCPWCNVRPKHAGHGFVKTTWEEVKKPEKWELGKCVKDRTEPCHIVQILEVVAGARGVTAKDLPNFAAELYEDARKIFLPGRD